MGKNVSLLLQTSSQNLYFPQVRSQATSHNSFFKSPLILSLGQSTDVLTEHDSYGRMLNRLLAHHNFGIMRVLDSLSQLVLV